MSDLLAEVVRAHGGLERWQQFNTVQTSIVSGGDLWGMKGLVQDPAPREMTVWLHEERASVHPYGAPDQRTSFTPGRIAIEKLDGQVVAERDNPRASFDGDDLNTPWDALDRAYFNGYALWTYLTTPFLMTMPGFTVTEIEPWQEGDQRWRGLRATFPPGIESHSTVQDFYFGADNLLRRHDYHVDVAGGFAATQYVYAMIELDGILLPSKRLMYQRTADHRALLNPLMVSIDFSHVKFS
jgi:hypothetical protein